MTEPLRILVVEDEALILMQIEMMLEEAGHRVVGTAMTAAEAIAQIEACRPELVLIDLRLADGSSGIEVAQAIRDRAGITAAFMTANARQLTEEMEGATAVISKPFSETVLEAALAYLETCVRRPPPTGPVPNGMRISPQCLARFAAMRP
ncbi:response regulator [Methylobacterium sp. HMF5984]|uniref:response regulator n=1 Tax=unclassified Methylobacterium TaxID=2615210 RepID=UPI0011C92208|nr:MULTISPECIES: response regulator [unclassified Methylobacterium]MCJ2006459.1 response regulator [Methylobacterium sp. J-092]MCJ2042207.1 response regulator [Methylobacterium sp. J-059]MCJ2079155.1 response regulator [Methylobacterium sp. E-016]MCJ2110994.1 response regulator [Methylobacterium sp. E-025]TXM88340.1 response regulator [Methylobacterium sp. WL116]